MASIYICQNLSAQPRTDLTANRTGMDSQAGAATTTTTIWARARARMMAKRLACLHTCPLDISLRAPTRIPLLPLDYI